MSINFPIDLAPFENRCFGSSDQNNNDFVIPIIQDTVLGLKMTVSPHRKRTFFQLLNIIDLMAIVPFFIEMFLFLIGINTEQLRDLKVINSTNYRVREKF